MSRVELAARSTRAHPLRETISRKARPFNASAARRWRAPKALRRHRQLASVDSGMSEDVENSLTGQGISDRETTVEADRTEE